MLFVLGILGFLQAIFLPGIIAYKLFNIKTKFSIRLIIIFALSMAINSNLVFFLCLTDNYKQIQMLFIILIEIICIVYLYINKQKYPTIIYNNNFIIKENNEIYIKSNNSFKLNLKYCYFIIIILLLHMLFGPRGLSKIGEVFIHSDAVLSWNRWGADLATIGRPDNPMGYPQLLPALLSIPYVLMADSWIQFFSFAICLLFSSCMYLIILSIFDKFPLSSFFMALILLVWGPIYEYDLYIGFADVPVAMLGFLATATILWGYKENEATRIKCLILSSIFLGATGAVKQAGLLLIIFFPFIIYEFKILSLINKKLRSKLIIITIFLVLFFMLPWNIYNRYLLKIGLSTSILNHLIDELHFNRTYIERIFYSMLKYNGIFISLLLCIPGIFIKENKSISLFAIFTIIVWMMFFSYDTRNSYIAFPFLTFSIGLTFQTIIIKYNAKIQSLIFKIISVYNTNKFKIALILTLITISIFLFSILKSDKINNYLYKRQNRKVLTIDRKESDNSFIINILNKNINSIIITNDNFLKFLIKDYKNRIIITNIKSIINNEYINYININDKTKTFYIYLREYRQYPSKEFNQFISNIPKNLTPLYMSKGILCIINNNNNNLF
ncbi:MAG: hypothetical protein LBS60_15170 [Deltaproteobacteria bacterium]|jgi:hypothetical protein|nr:hypothetical protein [Deltaproteobacteria bacterium]